MNKAYRIFSILLLIAVIPSGQASEVDVKNKTASLISRAELMLMLPSDADLNNIKRQQKAFQKGLYWTKNKTVKPLDRKS